MSAFREIKSTTVAAQNFRPSEAALANRSVGEQMAEASNRIQQSGGLLSLLGDKEMRQLRKDARSMAEEQAAALVIRRTELARETGMQAIDLERKQRLAQVAFAQTATTAELQKQAQAAGTRAITSSVVQEFSLQQEIAASRCSPEDKAVLAEFLKRLTVQTIENIHREQLTPFGHSGESVLCQPAPEPSSDSTEDGIDNGTDSSEVADS